MCVCIFPRWTKTHRLLLFLSSSLEYSQMWLLYQVFKKLDCRIKYTAFLRWSYRVIFCHYVCFLLNVRLIDLLRCAGVHLTSLQKNIWWNRIFFLVLSHIVQLLNQLISLMVLCFSFQYQYRNHWHDISLRFQWMYNRLKRREIAMFEPLLVANIVSTKQAAFETN